MDNNIDPRKEEGRFGDIALGKGFVTSEQVLRAIEIQVTEDLGGKKHRLIGQILLELGYLSTSQVNTILKISGILP